MWCWPGISRSRAAAACADPGAATIGESVLRVLVAELDLGEIETQFEMTDGEHTTYADLRIGRHLFEFDGRVKYEKHRREGETLDEFLMREKKREELVCLLTGWTCIRVTWADLARPELLASRIRRVMSARSKTN